MDNNCSFEKDNSFAKRTQHLFEKYLESEIFKKLLQRLQRRGNISMTNKIIYDDLAAEQNIGHIDCMIETNVGISLKIDFKAERYNQYKINRTEENVDYAIEVVSNPQGKEAGWGYQIGTTIIKGVINEDETDFLYNPTVFIINEDFVNNITRSNKYRYIQNKSTNGLYKSGFKLIPTYILRKYFGERRKKKVIKKNLSGDCDLNSFYNNNDEVSV